MHIACALCGQTIDAADFSSGRALRIAAKSYCKACMERVYREAQDRQLARNGSWKIGWTWAVVLVTLLTLAVMTLIALQLWAG